MNIISQEFDTHFHTLLEYSYAIVSNDFPLRFHRISMSLSFLVYKRLNEETFPRELVRSNMRVVITANNCPIFSKVLFIQRLHMSIHSQRKNRHSYNDDDST